VGCGSLHLIKLRRILDQSRRRIATLASVVAVGTAIGVFWFQLICPLSEGSSISLLSVLAGEGQQPMH
jgi:hypothetical protein